MDDTRGLVPGSGQAAGFVSSLFAPRLGPGPEDPGARPRTASRPGVPRRTHSPTLCYRIRRRVGAVAEISRDWIAWGMGREWWRARLACDLAQGCPTRRTSFAGRRSMARWAPAPSRTDDQAGTVATLDGVSRQNSRKGNRPRLVSSGIEGSSRPCSPIPLEAFPQGPREARSHARSIESAVAGWQGIPRRSAPGRCPGSGGAQRRPSPSRPIRSA